MYLTFYICPSKPNICDQLMLNHHYWVPVQCRYNAGTTQSWHNVGIVFKWWVACFGRSTYAIHRQYCACIIYYSYIHIQLGVVGHCICMAGASLNSKLYIFQNNTLANHGVLRVIRKV